MIRNQGNSSTKDEERIVEELEKKAEVFRKLDQKQDATDELVKYCKNKDEKMLFRLGRLLEKKKHSGQ
ncbi:hypothetical protein ABK040_007496 [Willaertia magna]